MRAGRRPGSKKILGTMLVVGMISAGTFAFTNTNTVPANYAGQGKATISGYVVSAIEYTSSSTNPHKMASVKFTLDQAAKTVKVSVVDAADNATTGATTQTWYSCSETAAGSKTWSCATGATDLLAPEMSATNELDVVAHQ